MINLRPYQINLVSAIRNSFRNGKSAPLVVSPTGSGKTVTFAHIASEAAKKGTPVVILVHRQELVDQTSRTLNAFGVLHGVIAAGRSSDRSFAVQVASVQTYTRRLDSFHPSLIIADEGHHAVAGSWGKVIAYHKTAKVIGFSATPERLDGRGLGDVFDDLILGPSVADLIENGHLAKPKYYAPPMVADIEAIHKTAGDYNKGELAAAMDKASITGDAVDHYKKICGGVPAVAFCASVAHAVHVADQFNAAGFRAATIDGTIDRETRRDRVRALGDGRLQVLTSCEIINEGFDLPIVAAAILLRPTMSLGLHLQQIGRVLRPAVGKTNAIILDHVGNLKRHGFAEDEREWTLGGREKSKRSKKDEEPKINVKQCEKCFCCHAPAPTCPECGFVYEAKGREIEQREGELVEIVATEMQRAKKKEQATAKSFEELVALGKSRGYKNPAGWARYVFTSRQNKRFMAASKP